MEQEHIEYKELQNLVREYNEKCRPYTKALSHINALKIPTSIIFNKVTGEMKIVYPPKAEIEIELEKYLDHLKQKYDNLINKSDFWVKLDRDIDRTQKMLKWLIDGQFIHGISPMMFPNIKPEDIEQRYNVKF